MPSIALYHSKCCQEPLSAWITTFTIHVHGMMICNEETITKEVCKNDVLKCINKIY